MLRVVRDLRRISDVNDLVEAGQIRGPPFFDMLPD